jgi:hypothetical protein
MAEPQQTRPVEPLMTLSKSITINAEFEVLLCVRPQYRQAISSAGAVKHLREIHYDKPPIRKQVQEFVARIL